MIIDISSIKDFDASLFHKMVENKDKLTVIGRNPIIEKAMKILRIDTIIKHEKEQNSTNRVLTEV